MGIVIVGHQDQGKNKNKLGLSWAKLSSNWNFVLLLLRFVELNYLDYIN